MAWRLLSANGSMPPNRLKITLLVALSACSNTAVPSRELSVPAVTLAAPSAPTPGQGGVVAQETALVTVELGADGSVTLSGVTRKPIAYRGSRLLPVEHPFDAVSQPGSNVRTAGEPAPERPSYVLVVQPPGAASQPRVVPLDLGARGEGGGDVVDRWSGSAVLVRAPSFGGGTRFTLLREGPGGSVQLAERTVTQ